MTDTPYQPPEYEADAFNCPICHAYAKMTWAYGCANWRTSTTHKEVDSFDFACCGRCEAWTVWYEEEQIYPREISVEDPNRDLPKNVQGDYIEAAIILHNSPRGSAALLRLAIQKLCNSLVMGDGDLNEKIGLLVKDGLDIKVQKALDVVRVIGNESVHPGQIDLNDTPEIAHQLFKLVNLIGRRMISEPKELDEIYNALPQAKIDGIKARDK